MNVTAHFAVADFACKSGDPYPVDAVCGDDGRSWLEARLRPLCETLEVIREAAGGGAIYVDSGYRTVSYDQRLYDKSAKDGSVADPQTSQHPRGRAADIRHESLNPRALHSLIGQLIVAGKLPRIGGFACYPRFVHIDVRPRPQSGHVAQWNGMRISNIV